MSIIRRFNYTLSPLAQNKTHPKSSAIILKNQISDYRNSSPLLEVYSNILSFTAGLFNLYICILIPL